VSLLDALRRLLGRAGDVVDEVDYAVIDAVHHVEDAVDDATGGRFYDTVEKLDAEANEMGEKLHLDDPRLDEASRG
jgi:hypothetical protein